MIQKVLLVSTMPTHPTDAGNRAAIMSQANILKEIGCEVHFLFVSMELAHTVDYQALASYWGDRLHIFSMNILLKMKRRLMDSWRGIVCNHYWKVDDHYPWGVAKYIKNLNEKEHFDACIIQYYRLSRLIPIITIPRKAIYTHDVFSYKDIRVGGHFYETVNAHEEAKALQRCPTIFAIQNNEAIFYNMLSPKSKVYTVYNHYQIHKQPQQNNKTILFLASRMLFNVTGIQCFLDKVWPLVNKEMPDVKLLVAGTVCERITGKYENVSLLGRVDKLDDFYGRGDIVINPVYQGTGLKIKTFEALSYGKATIVHPHSMIGIYNADCAPLLCSEEPEEWLQMIRGLINEPGRVEELGRKSIEYIEGMNKYIHEQYKDFLI